MTTIVNMHASIADMTGRRCGETPPAKEKTLNGPNTASSSAIACVMLTCGVWAY